MTLNEEQQQAYDAIMSFLETSTQDQMFCLKGYAGTGKTFLISRVIEQMEQKHPRKKVVMTAPTNKAVQVLRESASVSDKVEFRTIHSFLGLKEEIKDSGEIDFVRDFEEQGDTKSNTHILIIDEVSMLADKLFFEIKRYNNDIKIIMMGDPAQIPPVGKEDCEPFLNPQEHGIIEFQLTKIMRQSDGSAIINNSMDIRKDLSNEDIEWSDGADIIRLSASSQRDDIAGYFAKNFQTISDVDRIKIIAWTNRKVSEYNSYVRNIIFGKVKPTYVMGERLVLNKPFQTNLHLDKSKRDLLTTNQEVVVMDVSEEQKSAEDITYWIYRAYVKYRNRSGYDAMGYVDILHERSYRDFNARLNQIKSDAITGPTHDRRDKWKQYYKLLRTVADISYAYAITAHKSQGSTYPKAIVDVRNIQLNSNIVERNRIMYTAITRAKSELLIIT